MLSFRQMREEPRHFSSSSAEKDVWHLTASDNPLNTAEALMQVCNYGL